MNIQLNETQGIINLCISGDTLRGSSREKCTDQKEYKERGPETEAQRRSKSIKEISKTGVES